MPTRSWRAWRDHFEQNRLRPLPDLSRAGAGLPPGWPAALIDALQVFQLGESRGGNLSAEIEAEPGLDDDYRAAIKLFVGEEVRHGQLLALCLGGLGGRLITTTWSERLFVMARRLLGVRFKLIVLLAAETVGLGFYRTLASRLPGGPLRACLDELCADEVHHLAFHGDAFRGRRGIRLAWYPVVTAAGAVVILDHRRTLRTLGVPLGEAARRIAGEIRAVAADLAAPAVTIPRSSPAPAERSLRARSR